MFSCDLLGANEERVVKSTWILSGLGAIVAEWESDEKLMTDSQSQWRGVKIDSSTGRSFPICSLVTNAYLFFQLLQMPNVCWSKRIVMLTWKCCNVRSVETLIELAMFVKLLKWESLSRCVVHRVNQTNQRPFGSLKLLSNNDNVRERFVTSKDAPHRTVNGFRSFSWCSKQWTSMTWPSHW